jgi:hypothetical protein
VSLTLLFAVSCYGWSPFDSIIKAVDQSGQQIKTDILTELGVVKDNTIKLAESMDSLVKVTNNMDTKVTAYDRSQRTNNTENIGGNKETNITNEKDLLAPVFKYWYLIASAILTALGGFIYALIKLIKWLLKQQSDLFDRIINAQQVSISSLITRIEEKEKLLDKWQQDFILMQTNRIKELTNGHYNKDKDVK